MDPLKLISLRISEKSLLQAEKIASSSGYLKTAEVLRLAISLGLLICEEYVVSKLHSHMYEYKKGVGYFDINVKWVPND